MSDNWYYGINGQQQGPVTKAVLGQLFARGEINRQYIVWNEQLPDWLPIGDVPELRDICNTAPPPPKPSYSSSSSSTTPSPYRNEASMGSRIGFAILLAGIYAFVGVRLSMSWSTAGTVVLSVILAVAAFIFTFIAMHYEESPLQYVTTGVMVLGIAIIIITFMVSAPSKKTAMVPTATTEYCRAMVPGTDAPPVYKVPKNMVF